MSFSNMSTWFFMLGEPITSRERTQVHGYLKGLGIDDEPPVESVSGWDAAREVITNPRWDRRCWDAERLETQRLYGRASEGRGTAELLQSLSRTLEAGEAVHGAAAVAAARGRCSDLGLIAAASGAVSEALHLAELASLAGAGGTHPFFLKHELFAAGRWPLGAVGGRYYVF
jgi:hypothetical protein